MSGAAPRPYVALLRGINVGGNKRVPMAELRELATDLGYDEVATHLNSGNLVFTTTEAATRIVQRLEQAIEQRFGFSVSVVLRDRRQIAAILKAAPFGAVADNPSRYAIAFFDGPVPAAHVDAVREADGDVGHVHVAKSEIHVWCPNGLSNSTAMEALGKTRMTRVVTVRNQNTLRRIAQLLDERGGS